MRRIRRLVTLGVIVLGCVGLAVLLGDTIGGVTGIRAFEDFTLDRRQQTTAVTFQDRPTRERESDIVLVLFDALTVEEMPWISPFPRAHLAELIEAFAAAGARTIGVDVYLDQLFPLLNEIDGGDDRLRAAIERAGNVVLVSPVLPTDSGPVSFPPHPFFGDVARDVGTAELPSSFGTFRDGALAARSGQGLEPSFSLALYAHARGLDTDSLLGAAWQSGRVALPGAPAEVGAVPAEWYGGGDEDDEVEVVPFRVRFYGPPSSTLDTDPPGTFVTLGSSTAPTMSFLAPELFQDKIVLLGTGYHPEDRFRTPFFGYVAEDADGGTYRPYTWMYGVEIHANALQNLLDGAYVRPMSAVGRTVMLIVLAALTGWMVFWLGAGWGALTALASAVGTWVAAFWAWAGVVYVPGRELVELGAVGAWIPIATPVLAITLTYMGSVAYVAIVEGREKRFIKGAFGKYLSPDVVAEIAEHPEALTLGGEKRPLSLLFSDLSGFTTISEHMDAEELISLLNEYLNDMTQVVFDEDGYLDKYIGDAIMAFWNAPKDVPDHPDRAMRTAILMQRRMTDLNRRWRENGSGREALKVRIGVHSGEVVVGNVGGKDRFDYSAIGDDVNLAARLEPANKTYDTLNMVSEDTLRLARHRYRVRELDLIAVIGKEEPVRVFELLEMEGMPLDEAKEKAIRCYDRGMAAYREHRWADAKRHFEAAVVACPDDGPSLLYVARCTENIADPPPSDWDFVVRRTEK